MKFLYLSLIFCYYPMSVDAEIVSTWVINKEKTISLNEKVSEKDLESKHSKKIMSQGFVLRSDQTGSIFLVSDKSTPTRDIQSSILRFKWALTKNGYRFKIGKHNLDYILKGEDLISNRNDQRLFKKVIYKKVNSSYLPKIINFDNIILNLPKSYSSSAQPGNAGFPQVGKIYKGPEGEIYVVLRDKFMFLSKSKYSKNEMYKRGIKEIMEVMQEKNKNLICTFNTINNIKTGVVDSITQENSVKRYERTYLLGDDTTFILSISIIAYSKTNMEFLSNIVKKIKIPYKKI